MLVEDANVEAEKAGTGWEWQGWECWYRKANDKAGNEGTGQEIARMEMLHIYSYIPPLQCRGG